MDNADLYTYRVSWSAEDQEFVGTCEEFPSLSHLDPDPGRALHGISMLVRDVVRDLQVSGEPVPTALAERTYASEFVARVPGELHRRLAIEAAAEGVSLDRLVNVKLALPLRAGLVSGEKAPHVAGAAPKAAS